MFWYWNNDHVYFLLAMAPQSGTLAWKIPWMEEPGGLRSMGSLKSQTRLSDFTFTFHFSALEKEMATHSHLLAWRIPGTGEPGGLPSMGSHRVGHDWGDFAAAAAAWFYPFLLEYSYFTKAVLVSAALQRESAGCFHTSLFWISFPLRSPQSMA